VAVKVALVGLLLFGALAPDLPQFEGKAWLGRALTYPISLLIVPVGWAIVRRRRGRPVAYPYVMDILVALPFLIDTAGNAADLYDSIDWWDDANHFVNWAILVAAFCQLLIRLPLGRLAGAAIAIGFGAVTAILWEIGEYFAFIRNSPELATAYTDTLGDLALGLSGSVVAAVVTYAFRVGDPSLASRPEVALLDDEAVGVEANERDAGELLGTAVLELVFGRPFDGRPVAVHDRFAEPAFGGLLRLERRDDVVGRSDRVSERVRLLRCRRRVEGEDAVGVVLAPAARPDVAPALGSLAGVHQEGWAAASSRMGGMQVPRKR
jgi:hypothetical protein